MVGEGTDPCLLGVEVVDDAGEAILFVCEVIASLC